MSNKSYYEKYWKYENDKDGHANSTPQWPIQELEMFYNAIRKFVGKDILDIGAGEGLFLNYLQEVEPNLNKIFALEISEQATIKGKRMNSKVNYIQGSADTIYPFADQKFDTLFMTDVIEHLIDVDQAISECNRILKNGGRLIIVTPVFNWLKKIIIASFFWETFFYPNNPHIRFFTKKSLDRLMQKYKFKRVYYRWGLSWFGIMPQNAYFVYEK